MPRPLALGGAGPAGIGRFGEPMDCGSKQQRRLVGRFSGSIKQVADLGGDLRRVAVPRSLPVPTDLPVRPTERIAVCGAPGADRLVGEAELLVGTMVRRQRHEAGWRGGGDDIADRAERSGQLDATSRLIWSSK